MASDAHSSFGSLLKAGDGGGPEVFTTIAEVKTYGGFGFGGKKFPVSHHSSGAGFGDFIVSVLKEWKEFTVGVNFLPLNATQNRTTGLLSWVADGFGHNFQWVVPVKAGTVMWSFAAFVMSFDQTTPLDGPLDGMFTLQPTGAPTGPV